MPKHFRLVCSWPVGRRRVTPLTAVVLAGVIGGCAGSAGSRTTTSTSSAPPTSTRPAVAAVETRAPRSSRKLARRPRPRPRAPAKPGSALAALATLPVKGRAPMTGYSRAQFGDGWATVAGCDMRDRILARDLLHKRYEADGSCEIESGILQDPYTRERISYVRGGGSGVDIDHVVALGDAWQKGAQQWSASRRVAFANDPLELLSVSASANRAKGDGDAATWLPPNKSFRCAYVARQVAVKRKYGAWVTRAERDAIARVLDSCPAQRLPRAGAIPAIATSSTSSPAATGRSSTPKPAPTGGRVFANCAAVRAAGLAPLRRGTADYRANQRLDRDKDGLACE